MATIQITDSDRLGTIRNDHSEEYRITGAKPCMKDRFLKIHKNLVFFELDGWNWVKMQNILWTNIMGNREAILQSK